MGQFYFGRVGQNSIGIDRYALTQAYEDVFHRPDAVSYSKTGMLFGSELVKASTGFTFADGEIAGLFSDYVQNCVIGDIFLNHKYSMEDLMNSTDPYSKIFEKPSPLRGIFDKAGNFQTCQQAAVTLQQQIGTDSSGGGKTFSFWAQKLFGSRANREQLFASLLGDSYGYFYNAGSSASGIIKQNVVMNGLRKGISAYAARNGDTASMMNIATETATEKQIMQQSVSANIAMKYLPIMQTVLLGMMIGLFPVMIVLAIINTLTWTVPRGYIFTLAYLQAWPLLFAVLNNAMTFYLKAGGAYDVTLSNLSQIQQQHSMIASTAGWLSLSIPFIAYGMVKGLGGVVSQAGSYLSSMTQGVASQSSSQAVDGTYAFNNMQTDNVQGFKWDTNSTFAAGRRDQQLANGAMQGTTADGTTIVNSTTGTSKLPMDLNFGRAMSSSAQRLARESQVQAETSLQGFNHAMNSAYNQAQQFSQQTGNSNTMNTSTDDSQTAQATRGVSSMISAAKDYAKRHGISEQQAWAEIETKARQAEAEAHAGISSGNSALGKVAKWTIGADVGASGKISASTGSQSSADQRQTGSTDHTSSEDAKNVRDFREGKQILQSYRVSHFAVRNDNSSASQLEQIGTTLSVADSQYQQYTSSISRSHEYSKVASMSESETAQQTSNLSQEFVGYVQQKAPGDASRILTNTADENVRHEREALADSFVEEKLRSRIEGDFNSNRASLASGMQSVEPSTGDAAGTINSGQQEIERRAQSAGIKGNITQGVDDSLARNQGAIKQAGANSEQGHGDVQRESDKLERENDESKGQFAENYNNAVKHQNLVDLENKDGHLDIKGHNPGDISKVAKKLRGVMNKVGFLFPVLNITIFTVIAVSFFSPRNADYYILMLVFLLAAVVSSFVSTFTIRRVLPGYVKGYILMAILSSLGFYLLNRGSGAWDEGLIPFYVFMVLFQLAGGVVNSMIFFYYGKDQAEEMKLKGYPKSVIEKVYENILFRELERRIKGKVHPNVVSKVAGGIATGVLAETLSSGRADLFSDNLIPAAMSIADSHLVNFESGNYSVTGSHANDFNPATGLAMTSDYFDAGGDTYGSALNHDSLFSSDNHISGGFDNHSIDHGSSFSSGFDDSRY